MRLGLLILTAATVIVVASFTACSETRPAADATEAAPQGEINWSNVAAESDRWVRLRAMCRLLRHLDHWHGGTQASIALEMHHDGAAVDHLGNVIEMTPAEWKAIIDNAQQAGPDNELFALSEAMMRENASMAPYDDDFGTVTQYVYRFSAEPPARIVVFTVRRYEDK